MKFTRPKLYQLFLAANIIVPFLLSTIFFISFLMTFEMFRILQLMSSDDISFIFIISLMFDISLTLLPMAIPLSLFFSIIFTLGKMSADSEYVAMRAAGLTKFKILTPFMIVSFLVSINIYFINQQLIPNAHRKVRTKINIISSASLIQGIKSGQFFTAIPNITMFPASMDNETLKLEDVYLNLFSPKEKEEKVIWAKEGKILHEKNNETGLESFKLRLLNGNITSIKTDQNIEKILFQEYELPISEKKFNYTPSTKEIMMGKAELNDFIAKGPKAAKKKGFSKKEYLKAKFEYWNRLNSPLQTIIFAFLGFGLGVVGNRGKKKNSSGKAILFLIGYYIVYFTLINIIRDNNLPIILSVIVPSGIILFFAIRYYKGLDWLS